MKTEGAAGWHGKLPGVSDFASRRLDARFVDLWDGWISAGLAKMRSDDADGWVDDYLASPIWRFALPGGFFPAPFHSGAWVGVLMPSVDRVGRYYPLTLTAALNQVPQSADAQAKLWCWLRQLEDTALRALDGDWSIEALETELYQLGLPMLQDIDVPPAACTGPWVPNAQTLEFFDSAVSGSCAWYSEVDDPPQVLHSSTPDENICRLWER